MTNAQDDSERWESSSEDASASDAARAAESAAGASDTDAEFAAEASAGDPEVSADSSVGEPDIASSSIASSGIAGTGVESSASADSSSADSGSADSGGGRKVARVLGAVAVVAFATLGLGVASGWGSPGTPLGAASAASLAHGPSLSASPSSTPGASASPTPAASVPATTATAATPTSSAAPEPALDITTASSLTVLVNKHIPLDPINYAPDDLVSMESIDVRSMNDHSLRQDAADAVKGMFADAAEAGHYLDMTSGYREYDLQTQLYSGYVEEQGVEEADSTSARPGFSEHQTGLAADISAPDAYPDCILDTCFGETEAGQWLAENSWEYGFIVRYPEGETAVTGYAYEPWHFRFIGVEAAAEYHESGAATYEEFVGSGPAPDYK
ncbi:M15 family metallopeptidase [Gulosibacter molinativorax]|uniref:D-alanyl-D-alanine carboxypeptidase family protein n=1 Tax=Gulosibacter molinativorax TaxID=256821 RepID=A0ABT7C6L0_9MICO|nr:M15 family metallopeptidase [Gulosibacter molinativorax]MDJ1370738.1 D-alanyl-D-alanine carboxypeptidase family protein [Gulosibacter molinativorax]QUY63235.1 Putative carboxypeptidase YodJ [Gulosibacter molinativorax]